MTSLPRPGTQVDSVNSQQTDASLQQHMQRDLNGSHLRVWKLALVYMQCVDNGVKLPECSVGADVTGAHRDSCSFIACLL